MTSTSAAARLRYLDSASHLLFASSPSTSAFLQNEYRKTADGANWTQPEERQQKVCSACGTILISGITAKKLKVETSPKRRTRGNSSASQPRETLEDIECSRCNSRTRRKRDDQLRTPKLSKLDKKPLSVRLDLKAASSPSSVREAASSEGTTVTKRRKRKANGLQALLTRSKLETPATQPSDFGLDLKDFLQGN